MSRRAVVGFMGYALLGLLTSVSVAWGIALAAPSFAGVQARVTVVQAGDFIEVCSERRRFGRSRCELVVMRGQMDAYKRAVLGEVFVDIHTLSSTIAAFDSTSTATRARDLVVAPSGNHVNAIHEATGWPVACLWHARHGWIWTGDIATDPPSASPSPSAIAAASAPASGRSLPYRPIWGGLLVNTAAYECFWVGVVGLSGRARARVRVMRRRCGSCGYPTRDLPGAVCPECGCAVVTRRSRS